MAVVSMKQLLEAGVHFGHQTRRWNPKMATYIYTERNGIYIVDLQKTVKKLEEAYNFVKKLSENGQSLLFVGTKKQAQDAIREEALRCGMYYVNARWLGGMLTNFKTMRGRVDRLNQLKKMQEDGTFDMLPKKEVMKHVGEIAKILEIKREDVVFALDAIVDPVSLHEPVYSDGGDTICVMAQVRDDKNTDEHWLEQIALKEAMDRLTDREKRILSLRYFEGKTQMEVSARIGISQAQISRLEKNAIQKIKNNL